jgi:hypothetical protein
LPVFLEDAENNFLHEFLGESFDQQTDSMLGRILVIQKPILFISDPDILVILVDLIGQSERLLKYV